MAKDGPINLQGFASKATFVTSDISFAPGRLGVVHEGQQLVKLVDAAAVDGDVVYWKDKQAFTVTPTIGNSSRNEVAGVVQVDAAANDFIFVSQRTRESVKATGTIADGDIIIADASNNRVIAQPVDTSTTQTKFQQVGVARGAVSGGFVSADLLLESA